MLSPEQRRWRADKIGDLASIAVGTLLFGQLTSSSFRLGFGILSIVILLLAFLYSDSLLKHLN